MTDDLWRRTAFTDDTIVVELLLRLKQSSWDFSPTATSNPRTPSQYRLLLQLPVGWGQRQPRSKPATTTTTAAAWTPSTTTSCSKKEREALTRCSPTTPLSWSSASTSDESSRQSDLSSGDRSKSVFPTDSAMIKKSRKRKTFVQLKEEEGFLLKEMTHLKKEFASMQVTFKEQIATSANLKRLKHGLHLQSGNNMERRSDTIAYQFNQTKASSSFNQSHSMHDYRVPKVEKKVETQERGFVLPDLNSLPDLNMAPTEEETGAANLYVIS